MYLHMKKTLGITALFSLPLIGQAQNFAIDSGGTGGEVAGFLTSILSFINGVLIPFILGIGFLFFVWGMFQYFIAGGANDEKKESGKSLMVYATLGFVLIVVFWGVVNLVASGTGLGEQDLSADNRNNLLEGIEITPVSEVE